MPITFEVEEKQDFLHVPENINELTRFAVNVATNRGAIAEIFGDYNEALKWLAE